MKVCIVNYEKDNSWILSKFAHQLDYELKRLGVDSSVSSNPDANADVNHHIIYLDFSKKASTVDTVMITHVDYVNKIKVLLNIQQYYDRALCMSYHTVQQLTAVGLNKDKLTFVNPAHDETVEIRRIRVGIFSNIYGDGRKNENYLVDLSKIIDVKLFEFVIMGSGWSSVVMQLKQNGVTVIFYESFDKKVYNHLFQQIDYLLYLGNDEGSMSFIDALAAGVDTIVTKQGFHLDPENGITFGFENFSELRQIFKGLEKEKLSKINSVRTWTWKDYAIKHLLIWNELLAKKGMHEKVFHLADYAPINQFPSSSALHSLKLSNKIKYYINLIRTSIKVRKKISKK